MSVQPLAKRLEGVLHDLASFAALFASLSLDNQIVEVSKQGRMLGFDPPRLA
jgi:hypothetical protein